MQLVRGFQGLAVNCEMRRIKSFCEWTSKALEEGGGDEKESLQCGAHYVAACNKDGDAFNYTKSGKDEAS